MTEETSWGTLHFDTQNLLIDLCPDLTMMEAQRLIERAIPAFKEGCEVPVPSVLKCYALQLDNAEPLLLKWALAPKAPSELTRLRLARVWGQIKAAQ